MSELEAPVNQVDQAAIDQVIERHRNEQRELHDKIAALRKTAPKNNKSKKREVNRQISDLEYEMRIKHENELRQVKGEEEPDDGISLDQLRIEDEEPVAPAPTPVAGPKGGRRGNRKQKMQQKREEEMQRLRDEAEKEAEGQVDMAALEKEAIAELLVPMKLRVREITADGHCLYNAIANQLLERYEQQASYKDLRSAAAAYMREHPDDFIPFLYKDDGDMFSSEDFEKYCNDIEQTPRWGGQIEIVALSRAKQVPIHVVQMGAPTLKVNEEEFPGKKPLKLAYHKHLYSLGAHYNSLLDV